MAGKQIETEIVVPELRRGVVRLRIIGQTPMFQNRMAAKAKQQLLVGGRKKTAADRAQIKHHPIAEFRDSLERIGDGPTALGLRVVAMKAAMCTAAIETAGITKTSAQRLLFMPGELAALYGTPQLRMDIVRSADINRTPDVRTRAFLPKWGAEIEIHPRSAAVARFQCRDARLQCWRSDRPRRLPTGEGQGRFRFVSCHYGGH